MNQPLLPRIAEGQTPAVRLFVERYRGLIWSLARRYTRTREEAEDAVQDELVDLWRSAHRYDGAIGSESAFVAMVARRRLIDGVRRAGRRPLTQSVDTASHEPSAVDAHIEARGEAVLAKRALLRLRPARRDVLLLSACHGLSHSEIAAETGMPLGTVKTHARCALAEIRELLSAPSAARGAATEAWPLAS